MPDKYIYEPWKAPLAVQATAKCIVGKDYPQPIVDHAAASKANMVCPRLQNPMTLCCPKASSALIATSGIGRVLGQPDLRQRCTRQLCAGPCAGP